MNATETLFDWFLSATVRGSLLAACRRSHPAWAVFAGGLIVTLAMAGATRAQQAETNAQVGGGGIEKKLEGMILPKFELREGSLTDAVKFLHAKSIVLDPEKVGVNLLIAKSAETAAKEAKITLSLTNIPMSDALRDLSELAGFKLRYDETGVVLQVQGAKDSEPVPAEDGAAKQRLDAIVLPKVEFHETSLTEAVEFLQAKSAQLAPEKAVSITVRPAAAALAKDTKITLTLTNIPLSEALRYLAELAGVTLRFEAAGAVLDR